MPVVRDATGGKHAVADRSHREESTTEPTQRAGRTPQHPALMGGAAGASPTLLSGAAVLCLESRRLQVPGHTHVFLPAMRYFIRDHTIDITCSTGELYTMHARGMAIY